MTIYEESQPEDCATTFSEDNRNHKLNKAFCELQFCKERCISDTSDSWCANNNCCMENGGLVYE